MKTLLAILLTPALVIGTNTPITPRATSPAPMTLTQLYAPQNIKPVTFAWDASASTNVVAYNLYQVGQSIVLVGTTSNLTYQVPAVNLGATNFFAVSAVDVYTNESALSPTVAVSNPAAPLRAPWATKFTP